VRAFIGERRSDVHLLVVDAGVKAVSLARLDRLGLRVPPAIVLGAALSKEYRLRNSLPPGFAMQLAAALRDIEAATGLALGGGQPLLLSVRPSPVATMPPGLLPVLLNVGLTEARIPDLIRRSGNAWLAWDCYRRLVRGFATGVDALPQEPFDRLTAAHLARAGATTLQEIDPMSMRDLARGTADLRRINGAPPLPRDPLEQVVRAVDAVLAAWNAPHAQACRRIYGIDDGAGTAVLIQAMVFGNWGARSGSGKAFTHASTISGQGDDGLRVDFAFNAQGCDPAHADDSALLPLVLPEIWAELQTARSIMRHELDDVRHVDFTVEDARLYFLQTHSAYSPETPHALPPPHPARPRRRLRLARADAGDHRRVVLSDISARLRRRPSPGVADDVREERPGRAGADSA
jgi:pyruvate,orthophosphate dikinase